MSDLDLVCITQIIATFKLNKIIKKLNHELDKTCYHQLLLLVQLQPLVLIKFDFGRGRSGSGKTLALPLHYALCTELLSFLLTLPLHCTLCTVLLPFSLTLPLHCALCTVLLFGNLEPVLLRLISLLPKPAREPSSLYRSALPLPIWSRFELF